MCPAKGMLTTIPLIGSKSEEKTVFHLHDKAFRFEVIIVTHLLVCKCVYLYQDKTVFFLYVIGG